MEELEDLAELSVKLLAFCASVLPNALDKSEVQRMKFGRHRNSEPAELYSCWPLFDAA